MLKLYLFLRGFLNISITTENIEKLLNNTASYGIILRRFHYNKHKLYAVITVSDFKRMRVAARKTNSKIHILSRHGLPFIFSRFSARYGLLAGFCIFVCIMYVLSLFVWSVRVTGNSRVDDREIFSLCEKIGIHEGMLKAKISPITDAQRLLLQTDSLAWASLNIEGSVLTVNVSEIKNEIASQKQPNDLIATTDGKITKLDLTSGNAVVKVGDYVNKGDLLVSGILEGLEKTEFVPSVGSVFAETQHTFTFERPFVQTVKSRTGRSVTKSVLSFFTLKIPLYVNRVNFKYETAFRECPLTVFGEKLPVTIYKKEFYEVKKQKITYTKQQIKEQLLSDYEKTLKKHGITDSITDEKQFSETNDSMTLTCKLTTVQDIAEKQAILINSSN